MATVKFRVLHKSVSAQIYVRFSISRELVFQSKTGKTINPIYWSAKNSAPIQKLPEYKKLAVELNKLSLFIIESYNEDYSSGIEFSKKWLDGKIDIFFNRELIKNLEKNESLFINYLDKYRNFKKSISTTRKDQIVKLNNLFDRFAEYEAKKKKNFAFEEITGKILIDFKDYLVDDCNLASTTAARFIKNIKTVLFDAQDNGNKIHHQVRGFSAGKTNADYKVFLSFDEINRIKNINTFSNELNIAKDWLVLGCFLGQRSSDLLRMNKKMIYTKTDSVGNSFRFIELTQKKTKDMVVIPLHDEVEEILLKYEGEFPPVFSEKPDSNSALFNRHIKKVCEIAKIHDLVKGKVYNEDLKKNEIVETEKCHLVSTHVCRRSFATNFYGNKLFTTPQLMAITGHKSESQFLNYIGKTADDWAMQTAKTFKEMSDKKLS
ncbi:phage integrase SAM-like domain-containing protein [Chryseobacterium indologenes]|uniref:phage integrase SAM-like domain-containing protein n=1 Tax=Chryseobacterium indologenes TaxID=253 RepID=UPI00162375B0|nr:phage integrase SAM-like domain-containing protein [Chryseobacterium indologenes]